MSSQSKPPLLPLQMCPKFPAGRTVGVGKSRVGGVGGGVQIKLRGWKGGRAGEKGSSHGGSRGGSQEGKSLATFSSRGGMQEAPRRAWEHRVVEEEVSLRARLYVALSCQGSLFNLALFSSPALCWGGCDAAIVPAAQERPGRSGRSPSAGRRSLNLRSLFPPGAASPSNSALFFLPLLLSLSLPLF